MRSDGQELCTRSAMADTTSLNSAALLETVSLSKGRPLVFLRRTGEAQNGSCHQVRQLCRRAVLPAAWQAHPAHTACCPQQQSTAAAGALPHQLRTPRRHHAAQPWPLLVGSQPGRGALHTSAAVRAPLRRHRSGVAKHTHLQAAPLTTGATEKMGRQQPVGMKTRSRRVTARHLRRRQGH